MRRQHWIVALLGLCAGIAHPAAAQQAGLVLDAAGGVAIPVGSFADGAGVGEGADAGASLSVAFVFPRSDRWSLRFGFSQHRFGCEGAGCAAGDPYVATGFDVGTRISLLPGRRVDPWIGLAGITTRVETWGLAAPNAGISKLGFGGEASFGLSIRAGGPVSLRPSVAAATVGSDLPGGSRLTLRYVSALLGLSISF